MQSLYNIETFSDCNVNKKIKTSLGKKCSSLNDDCFLLIISQNFLIQQSNNNKGI